MFSLFYGCYEAMVRKEELHVLIIGLDRAGKTTLLEKLKTLFTDCPGLEADKVCLQYCSVLPCCPNWLRLGW